MDRSLDEIIAERPNQNQNRGRRQPQNRRRDGVKKPYRDERVDLDRDWVHDKFEDDRDGAFVDSTVMSPFMPPAFLTVHLSPSVPFPATYPW
ncbi:hypothetical protein ASPZODRAFT_1558550 [Penicilliopsis zonata CBS 506.65]|uniref:Uncharacterized protein n=1 Tax=Penicilliopsis zonata CBS 506.65 TaxID=1073090 RepID=A0A1L9SM81_9EURO|nr:hypothetical protein ASPZODRAFT_1558550 [Penicilliopsis zonata CBS 506.65]OJJ48300.1 hypothetical protein ASPZODRAFT_1558550 [Penicilliopsis zonata CBS 506.65]